jgi:hypothetical protein
MEWETVDGLCWTRMMIDVPEPYLQPMRNWVLTCVLSLT